MSLVLVINQSIGQLKFLTFHPEEDMNVHAKFHGNLSNSFWDISLKIDLMLVQKSEGITMSLGFILWGPQLSKAVEQVNKQPNTA